MKIKVPSILRLGCVLLVAAEAVSALPASGGAAGTTLSETVSANAQRTRTFNWQIGKTADPTTIDQFQGDSSTVTYTVKLTKDDGIVRGWIDGQVCITNGGSVATVNLASTIEVTQPPSTAIIASTPLDVSANPVLAAGQTYCYSYSVDIPSGSLQGGTYKVTARTTITNHSGHLNTPFGPSASTTTTMPATETLVHNSVAVSDSMQGSLGTFSQSDTATYTHPFHCDSTKGYTTDNTASITYDDNTPGPTATATVTVQCYALQVSKTVTPSLTRTYTWSIEKSADQSSLSLATGQTTSVNYQVKVQTTNEDSKWAATGQITVKNPAPIDATINSVTDALGQTVAKVVCPGTFPYTLAAGDSLTCTYEMALPDGSGGTNTATATLQNHGVASGTTTDFTGTAPVDFSFAQITIVDATATLSDTYPNSGLPATVDASSTPATYTYVRQVGSYSSPGSYMVDNTATVAGTDTGKGGSSSVSIPVTVTGTSGGCTRTIGYWKTHPDEITPLLPIWLGTQGGTKSVDITTSAQAVTIEGIPDASNGIDKLYAQFLAAKLSIAKGADPSAVSSTIQAADNFLAAHNHGDWSGLSTTDRNQVNAWASTLDNFNNGITGPGHCS